MFLRISFQACAPANAADPATNAPINELRKIRKVEEPPRGRINAILWDRIPLLFESILQASNSHKRKTPTKPAKKDMTGF